MVERAGWTIGRSMWTRRLADHCWRAYPADRPRELTDFIAASGRLPSPERVGRPRHRTPTPVRHGELRWPVPVLDTIPDLAGWLGLDVDSLGWYADPQRRLRHTNISERLRHYRCTWVPKQAAARMSKVDTPGAAAPSGRRHSGRRAGTSRGARLRRRPVRADPRETACWP
ncbi:hypothetical protein [Fodinicola acaciae]|uniref:hypothetical protein n=1 Tax=Fodinicola acaciae TaxID=2681555 RepID=UPI0013D5A191|nr:hypothetical protein [Fodinicola acaciae]